MVEGQDLVWMAVFRDSCPHPPVLKFILFSSVIFPGLWVRVDKDVPYKGERSPLSVLWPDRTLYCYPVFFKKTAFLFWAESCSNLGIKHMDLECSLATNSRSLWAQALLSHSLLTRFLYY